MKKVVVERPRWGSRVRNQKFGKKLRYIPGHDYAEEPKKARGFESFHDGCGKYFTDVLGPLRRYLHSNLRRPWNKIYSEMCASLDKRKTTGRHIFQHVEQMVERDCYVGEDGKVRYSRYRNHILGGDCSREVRGFYVHPRTGLLCLAPRESKRERKLRRMPSQEAVTRLYRDNNVGYQKHEGIWYRIKLSRIVVGFKDPITQVHDIFLKQKVRLNWGVNWVATEKKQCNREELKEVKQLLESGKGREPLASS